MTGYEPADVADAIIAEARNCRIDKAIITVALQKMGVLLVDPGSVVTLDPNKPDHVARLSAALLGQELADDYVREALRSLLPTPPLPEPNGLGAVVETSDGMFSLGVDGLWRGVMGGPLKGYPRDPVGPPHIQSHGVGCTCGGPGCPGGDDALPIHRTEAGYPRCSTCDGGGCPDCTDPAGEL